MSEMRERQIERWRAAAKRLRDRDIKESEASVQAGETNLAEEEGEDRIRTRLARKGMTKAAVDAVVVEMRQTRKPAVLERILKGSQLQDVDFLAGGARTSRMVGRIVIRSGGSGMDGFGTGFMVSPTLMLTNNHVLPNPETAAYSFVQFDYMERKDGTLTDPRSFDFDPAHFFVTHEPLDFTLVAVRPVGRDGDVRAGRGWLPFIRASGKALKQEPVNLIQHPEGGPMQVALRENMVIRAEQDALYYTADTLSGSSGAPVCNDDWDLAALHRAAAPKTNENGDFLLVDGSIWDGNDYDLPRVDWVANEGTRISWIVAYLDRHLIGAAEDILYQECFRAPAAEAFSAPDPVKSQTSARSHGPVQSAPPDSGADSRIPSMAPLPNANNPGGLSMTQDNNGEFSFYFKVTITPMIGGFGQNPVVQHAPQQTVQPQPPLMSLPAPSPAPSSVQGQSVASSATTTTSTPGTSGVGPSGAGASAAATPAPKRPAPAPVAPATPPAAAAPESPVSAVARMLFEERRNKSYYDKVEDARAREEYYAGIDFNVSPDQLFHDLAQLTARNHRKQLSYKESRHRHLYPWVDLRPNGELFSIYSDDEMGAEKVLRRELEAMARRRAGPQENFSAEQLLAWLDDDLDDEDIEESFGLQEAISGQHNCEHVVPQSWFDKRQPMRADMHHLFACEMKCNGFRGNLPYFDFDPFLEAERHDCGRKASGKFEPTYNHGVVARATLYFILRYPGEIGDQGRELQSNRLDTLKNWHRQQKIDLYELHRNAEIAKVQGNRNPLIDFPELIDKVNFRAGMG